MCVNRLAEARIRMAASAHEVVPVGGGARWPVRPSGGSWPDEGKENPDNGAYDATLIHVTAAKDRPSGSGGLLWVYLPSQHTCAHCRLPCWLPFRSPSRSCQTVAVLLYWARPVHSALTWGPSGGAERDTARRIFRSLSVADALHQRAPVCPPGSNERSRAGESVRTGPRHG